MSTARHTILGVLRSRCLNKGRFFRFGESWERNSVYVLYKSWFLAVRKFATHILLCVMRYATACDSIVRLQLLLYRLGQKGSNGVCVVRSWVDIRKVSFARFNRVDSKGGNRLRINPVYKVLRWTTDQLRSYLRSLRQVICTMHTESSTMT